MAIERVTTGDAQLATALVLFPGAAAHGLKAYRRAAAGWKTDAPLAAAAPAANRASASTAAAQQTGDVTVTPSGGIGDLEIVWARIAGAGIDATAPAGFTTAFAAAGLADGEARNATFEATVTDEALNSVVAGQVAVTITRWSQPSLAAPSSAGVTGPDAAQQTGDVTAVITGGTGPFTTAWAKRIGGGAITATAPAALVSQFSAAGLANGETRSAIFDCTVTDANGLQATTAVNVQISRIAALTLALSPAALNKTGTAADLASASATASASGGQGPFTYAWAKIAGGAIASATPAAPTTSFTATALAVGESRSATFRCTVTDNFGTQATADIEVTITRNFAFSVTLSTTADEDTDGGVTVDSHSISAYASGAAGPYTYAWQKQAGDAIAADSPAKSGTRFIAEAMAPGETRIATFRCLVTDNNGAQGISPVLTVTLHRGG